MKDALKKLVRAANDAPVGTESLEGEGGLIPTHEESETGPSRVIHLTQGQ